MQILRSSNERLRFEVPNSISADLMCRLSKSGPQASVFMSSLAIVAIAWDRHRCIVNSNGAVAGRRHGHGGAETVWRPVAIAITSLVLS